MKECHFPSFAYTRKDYCPSLEVSSERHSISDINHKCTLIEAGAIYCIFHLDKEDEFSYISKGNLLKVT